MSARKDNRAAALIDSGARELQQGRTEQARLMGEQALKLAPRNPDALHLLGVIALQRSEHAAATDLLQRAVAIRPGDPAFRCNLAYAYVGLKRLPQALDAFERAARLDPGDPDLQLGIGNCLGMMGKAAESEAVLRRLTARHPEHPLAWFNLANAVKDQERYEEARDLYVRVTQLAPQFAEAHCNLGVALHRLERYEEAERAFRACLGLKPDFVAACVSLAVTLNCLRQHTEAEALCREALARDPGQKNALPVLARALTFQHRWREAVECYQQTVREFPENSDAYGALGSALARTDRLTEAMQAFDRALALGNVSVHTRFAKAVALFAAGRMAEGAAEYAGRHERSAFIENHPERALAAGLPRDLRDQVVCLHGEQGIGDELFFLRFAPLLKARGGSVILHGHPKLAPVVARCGALDRVLPNAEPYASADHILFVGDLLAHFLGGLELSSIRPRGISHRQRAGAARPSSVFPRHSRVYWPQLPPPLPLAPLPERLASSTGRLRSLGPPPYLGLTWRAGTGPLEQRGHLWSLYKEIPLERFATALRGVEGTLISLQRRPEAGETQRLATLAGRTVHDLSVANEDLEEMLALLAVLDDYIGVSNTNMHLRAGVRVTARVLVPWPAEWRWLTSGEASPWFPGFRVYRQDPNGDWSAALKRLARDVAQGG